MKAIPAAPALDAFRAAVMRDAAAQQLLVEQFDPARFEALSLDYAQRHGIALTPADLRVDTFADPLGIHRFGEAPQTGDAWPDPAWLPTALQPYGQPGVDWCHFGGIKPTRPFFHASLIDAVTRPFNRLFRYRTPFDVLLAGAQDQPRPRGLIFHMSRCGSTLVSQMLGAAHDIVVLSEPEPFDAALQMPFEPDVHPHVLRAIAAGLGRGHAHAIIKTDAWHTLAMPLLLERAFPGVPWIFLYRDPIEVLVSHARMPGRHVAPGVVPALDAISEGTFGADHAARVLARVCEAVLAHGVGNGGLLVNYSELPTAVFTRILPHFGIEPGPLDRTAMLDAATRDAKTPAVAFQPDGEQKRGEATHAAREAVHHLAPVYAELEALRAASR